MRSHLLATFLGATNDCAYSLYSDEGHLLVELGAGESVYEVYCGNPRVGRCLGSLYFAVVVLVSVVSARVQDYEEDVAVVSIS